MAHFAQLDENNIVTQVLVIPNEQEHRGQEYLNELGFDGTWVQTSYNATFGGKFAGVGDVWDGIVFTTPEQEGIDTTVEPTE